MIFKSAEIDVIVHATEDSVKILDAIKDVLKLDSNLFMVRYLEGHYKNEIRFMQAKITLPKTVNELASRIFTSLSKYERSILSNNVDKYIDRNTFYIRLSKQDLIMRKVSLFYEDPIRIKFKLNGFKPSIDNIRKLILCEEET